MNCQERFAFARLQGSFDTSIETTRPYKLSGKMIFGNKQIDGEFLKIVIFSDEAHFHLTGFVNKQNY